MNWRKFVVQEQESYPPEIRKGEIGLEILMAVDRLALGYLETKDYQNARDAYQKILVLCQQLTDIEERQRQLWLATTYHQLGAVAQELREYGEARQNYQQALAIKIEFGDRSSQAGTYHQLGSVAQHLREYGEARQNYQQALAIKIEFGDRYAQAGTYGQLGAVALELREYEESKLNYKQAIAIFEEFNDRYSQAISYLQLGRVAEELREYEEAKNNLLQALNIWHEFKDEYSIKTFSIPSLSRLYQATQDDNLLQEISQISGITIEEVRQKLEST